MDKWRLVDAELNAGVELDAAEWRAASVEKAAGTVENVVAGGRPGGEEREDDGRSGAVENTAAVWSR